MTWIHGITRFGDYLAGRLKVLGWKPIDLASRLPYDKGNVSKILANKRAPPLKTIEHWANVLGLKGDERDYFLDLAALANTEERVLRMFEPEHPAHESIRLAIENESLRKLRAAETGEPYEPKKSPRKSRRSPQ